MSGGADPDRDELARRAANRVRATAASPPRLLGVDRLQRHLRWVSALSRPEPGDVIVAVTTGLAFNAVIGVPGLFEAVADGAVVEVDPVVGSVRIVEDIR